MSWATFKDLGLDASDASVAGAFWSAALGLELRERADGHVFLSGPTKAHTIWINQVPEAKVTKHRVHLDIHGSAAAELQALGASVVDDQSFPWVVMADPEDGEFCLFIREAPPAYRLHEIVVDCTDHEFISRWWTSMIGGTRHTSERGFSYIDQIPNAPFDSLCFIPVEEPKRAKNRVHLDLVAPTVDPLLNQGATLLRRPDDDIGWHILADPEGNEFCVFPSH